MEEKPWLDHVEIEIENSRRFGEVAFLVDRGDFRRDTGKIRKKYPSLSAEELLENDNSYKEIAAIRKKYRKGLNFRTVIAKAIAEEVVEDSDYLVCAAQLREPKDWESWVVTAPELVIAFEPDVTQEDLEKEIKERVPGLIAKYNKLYRGKSSPDTIPNIKRDRDWYWQHRNGRSYQDILAVAAVYHGERITRDGVIKAVKQYEKRLNTPL